ncbi:MAG: MaoC family dehydratase N-terminal domain-containing protein [Chloroflexi bacterium]|nr:MaoC family dehydratase N-terminal domain-containing protein [Chloroflexota bacterium]
MTTETERRAAREAAASNYGKITEQGIGSMQARMGTYYYGGRCLGEVSADEIRMMALREGERNPLYLDEEYGKKTRYGSMIAPGAPSHRNFSATNLGGLPGVMSFNGGGHTDHYRVVRPGDIVGTTFRPYKIVTKTSRYAGHSAVQYSQGITINQDDEVVAKHHAWSVRTERAPARERNTLGGIGLATWTREQIEAIWDEYDKAQVRGASPRYWEDVKVGDDLPGTTHGPLRRSTVVFNAHFDIFSPGLGSSPGGNFFYRWDTFRRYRAFAERDPVTNVPDHPHRGHWQDGMAALIALPGIYALGHGAGTGRIVRDWMGDDAFIRLEHNERRRFFIESDVRWVKGKVVRKWVEGPQHIVEIEVWSENQRGEVISPSKYEVVLPSKSGGYVPM